MTPKEESPKKRDHAPWRVYRLTPGDGEDGATTLELASEAEYASLAEAEQQCETEAATDIGVRYVAAKCGRVHLAEEVRTVEVRKS